MTMCVSVSLMLTSHWSDVCYYTDADGDPSVHPKTATLFLTRSTSDKHRKSMHKALVADLFIYIFIDTVISIT